MNTEQILQKLKELEEEWKDSDVFLYGDPERKLKSVNEQHKNKVKPPKLAKE